MKLIGFGLLCLLCPLAWAAEFQYDSGSNDTEFQLIAANPVPIASTYSGSTFVVSTVSKLNFFEAMEWCASRGWTLKGLSEDSDQDDLYSGMRGLGLQKILSEPLWIAGSSLEDGVTWYWYDANGEKIPNLYNLPKRPPPKGNFCLGFKATDGKWSTHPCTEKRYFICAC